MLHLLLIFDGDFVVIFFLLLFFRLVVIRLYFSVSVVLLFSRSAYIFFSQLAFRISFVLHCFIICIVFSRDFIIPEKRQQNKRKNCMFLSSLGISCGPYIIFQSCALSHRKRLYCNIKKNTFKTELYCFSYDFLSMCSLIQLRLAFVKQFWGVCNVDDMCTFNNLNNRKTALNT